MRARLERWSTTITMLILLPVLGLTMTVAGELVSDQAVASALLDAVDRGIIGTEARTKTVLDVTVDHHSECVGLTTGLGDAEQGLLEVALSSPNLGRCESAVARLLSYDAGNPLVRDGSYLRYWHGHTIVTRPVLAVAGVVATRAVVLVLLLASMTLFAIVLRRRVGTVATLLFLAPMVIGTDLLVTPWGGPHGVAAVAVFGGGALLVAGLDGRLSIPATATLAALSAGLVVLVDVFTFGTVSWVMTTNLVGVVWWVGGTRGRDLARPMSVGAAAWAIGYGWTWFTKWALAGLVVGFGSVWDRISAQVATRTLGEVDYIELGLGNTTSVALESWLRSPLGGPLTLLIGAWLAFAVAQSIRARTTSSLVTLASPAALVVAWFEVMQNHTQVHRWFTASRGVAVAAAAILIAAELARRTDPGPVEPAPDAASAESRS